MENVAEEQGLALQQRFPYKLLNFIKIQTVIKSHPLLPGASNLAIFLFSTGSSISAIANCRNVRGLGRVYYID